MFRPAAATSGLLLLATVLVPAGVAARSQEVPVNEHGLPVQDERGQRIVYGREELEARIVGALRSDSDAREGAELSAREESSDGPGVLPPSGVTARWGYAGFGSGIGLSNIVLSDGDIITGGSVLTFGANDYFYVLRPLGATYEQVFVSRRFPGLVALGAANVAGDARKEIVVVQSNGSIALFDQRSRTEIATLAVAASGVAGMTLRDLDGDSRMEILLTTSSALYVLSGTGTLLWQQPGAGGVDVTVGNMDSDASLEIATTSGAVIDWTTRSVQWTRPQGFGIDVEVGDIDGDGMDELIAAQAWDFIWAFDVDTQLPKWSLPMFNTGAIWVGNVDGDADIELLVGEAQWGDILAFNAATLVQEWAIPNPEHGVTFVAVGDPNGNGTRDVLWGSGASSTGSDRLYVANLATRTIDWENVQLEGPFLPPQYGDIDGDGMPEMVTASTSADSGYDSGRIVVFDGATLRVRGISAPVAGNSSLVAINALRLRNVDADPQLEIVIATDRLYDGLIEIYDFGAPNAFTLKWDNATRPTGAPFHSVEVADVDADGQLEVVGGGGKEHTGSQGTFIYVYNYQTRAEEWHSFALTTGWLPINGLAVLTAGGGVADIVAMVGGESLNFFNGLGTPQAIVNGNFSFLGPYPPGTATRTFMTAGDGGVLRQYEKQGPGYAIAWTRTIPGAMDGVSIVNGTKMAVTSGGRLTLYPTRDAPAAWTSEDYGVRRGTMVGIGSARMPFVGGLYGVVRLAPWLTLLDVQPPIGPSSGGTMITATGTAFDPAAQLFVGGYQAVATSIPSSTQAVGTTPNLPMCTSNTVMVVNPDMSFELLEDAFRSLRPGDNWNRCRGF